MSEATIRRVPVAPRKDWQKRVERGAGLTYHTDPDGYPYWRDSEYYECERVFTEGVRRATQELHERCLDLVDQVCRHEELFEKLHIDSRAVTLVKQSWEAREPTLYGRFDLLFEDAKKPVFKLLEYNADTSANLLETSVAQAHWLRDVFPERQQSEAQFNEIHARLLDVWPTLGLSKNECHILCCKEYHEDIRLAEYLQRTAELAGVHSEIAFIEELFYDEQSRLYVDSLGREIHNTWKMYPWEWLVDDELGAFISESRTRFLEPAWKMLLSNKAILPLLWQLNPGHENLVPAHWSADHKELRGKPVIEKSLFGREGESVTVYDADKPQSSSPRKVLFQRKGHYDKNPSIFQSLVYAPEFDGVYKPTIGGFVVGNTAAGMSIREEEVLVSGNMSYYVPHCVRAANDDERRGTSPTGRVNLDALRAKPIVEAPHNCMGAYFDRTAKTAYDFDDALPSK